MAVGSINLIYKAGWSGTQISLETGTKFLEEEKVQYIKIKTSKLSIRINVEFSF